MPLILEGIFMNPQIALYTYLGVLFLAFIISAKFRSKVQVAYLKTTTFFLLLTVLVEIVGYVFSSKGMKIYNHLLFNNFFCSIINKIYLSLSDKKSRHLSSHENR